MKKGALPLLTESARKPSLGGHDFVKEQPAQVLVQDLQTSADVHGAKSVAGVQVGVPQNIEEQRPRFPVAGNHARRGVRNLRLGRNFSCRGSLHGGAPFHVLIVEVFLHGSGNRTRVLT
jgi:hypothetical protein